VLFWPNANWTYSLLLNTEITHGDIDLTEAIPDFLIDYVGHAAFENWLDKNEVEYTVLENFITDFDIAKEKVDKIKTEFITKRNAVIK
jgi:hypothetical protein